MNNGFNSRRQLQILQDNFDVSLCLWVSCQDASTPLPYIRDIKILIVTQLSKLKENTFFFGKYKELDVSVLEKIDMKYIETFKNLYTYLTYFSHLKGKYDAVIIDDIVNYVYEKDIANRLKKVFESSIFLDESNNLSYQ